MTFPTNLINTKPTAAVYWLLLAVAAASLMLEVSLLRIFSVKLWYPFSFVLMATAMCAFGFGAAAAMLNQSRQRAMTSTSTRCCWSVGGFALSAVVGYLLWNRLPADPIDLLIAPSQWLLTPLLYLMASLPFIFSGFLIATLFAVYQSSSPKLYAVDLTGATIGVLLYLAGVEQVGCPGVIFLAAALALLAVCPLVSKKYAALVGLFAAGLIVASLFADRYLPVSITHNKAMAGKSSGLKMWSSSSLVQVVESSDGTYLYIDGGTARTYGPRANLSDRPVTPYSQLIRLPFHVTEGKRVAVIGSGAGIDVAEALHEGATHVLALEVDSAINHTVEGPLLDELGWIFKDPAVKLVTAEARSYLARHHQTFDIILMPHTITNAAMVTGAMGLAENYLLTREALSLLLSLLSEHGVLLISRPEEQLPRLVAGLRDAWGGAGSLKDRLSDHVAVLASDSVTPSFIAGVMVTKNSMDTSVLEKIKSSPLARILYLPDRSGESFAYYASILDPISSSSSVKNSPFVATDDQPFFNLQRSWSSLQLADFRAVFTAGRESRRQIEGLPVSQVVLIALSLMMALVTAGTVFYCLRHCGKTSALSDTFYRESFFYAALGFSFMLVEVILIQIFGRIIGMPGLTMAVVLTALLLSTAMGSLFFAGRLQIRPTRGATLCFIIVLILAFVAEPWSHWLQAFSFAVQCLAVMTTVGGVGLVLGIPFSGAVQRTIDHRMVAWAFVVNSLFTVWGSIGALMLASAFGFRVALVVAALGYLVAAKLSGKH